MADVALTREQILDAIRDYVEEHGKPPGKHSFKQRFLVPASAFDGMYWSRWSDAVREAGFDRLSA